jgi:helix-turn-helix, Psq domain.
MPPIRVRNKQDSIHQEGRILLAIQALQKKDIPSVAAAARVYNVPRSTLRGRVNGALSKPTTRANNVKLSQKDEDILTKWILSMDDRGAAPRPPMVRRMADILLAATSTDTVGKNWVGHYIERTPAIQLRFSRQYHYARA